MTKLSRSIHAPAGGIARLMVGFGPRIMLAPDTGTGTGEQSGADTAAADKAAADKAAADKAEADRAAQEEADKNLTDAEREKKELLREVMDKKGKLKEETAAREAAEAALKKFDGIDLDQVKALLEAQKDRERADLEAKGEFDRLKQMIADERKTERSAWEKERDELTAQIGRLSGTIDTLTVGQSFASSTFISEDLVLTPTKARALYGSHFEMKDGKTVAYDKPAGAATRTMLIGADGEPLSFDAAMRKIIDADPEKDTLLKAKIAPGASSKTSLGTKSSQEQKSKEGELHGRSRILAGLNAGK